MYKLTLTIGERRAIDWVGDRYSHGYDLFRLLWVESEYAGEADWDTDCDITFDIPEHIAWQIRDIGEECNYQWDCFSPDFAKHLTKFCDDVV